MSQTPIFYTHTNLFGCKPRTPPWNSHHYSSLDFLFFARISCQGVTKEGFKTCSRNFYVSFRISRLTSRFFISSRLSPFFRERPKPSSILMSPFFVYAESGRSAYDFCSRSPERCFISSLRSRSRRMRPAS